MIAWLDKKVKKMDTLDVTLTKLSVAAAVLFIITVWPAAMDLVRFRVSTLRSDKLSMRSE